MAVERQHPARICPQRRFQHRLPDPCKHPANNIRLSVNFGFPFALYA
jgi:hypothetical protein